MHSPTSYFTKHTFQKMASCYLKSISFYLLLTFTFCGWAQSNLIHVTENTLKIGGMQEEVFYYAFASGDQIVFYFEELDHKTLKEVEITEYPATSRFMDYKTQKIDGKIISVSRTGVYAFRLNNEAIFGRICKIKIDRIPGTNQTIPFNTSVSWMQKQDTTWNMYTKQILVGYDTLMLYKTKKEIFKTEFNEEIIADKNERVSSKGNKNGNKSSVFFTIPSYPSTQFIKKTVTAMVYWIGVGEEANVQWQKNTNTIKKSVQYSAGMFTSPLGAYALGTLADLALPAIGEDVEYALVNEQNKNLFYAETVFRYYDKGKGIAGFKKMTDPFFLKGSFFIVMSNDNYMLGINVTVKISVLVQTDYYEEKPYTEQQIKARYETRICKEPIIKLSTIPVIAH